MRETEMKLVVPSRSGTEAVAALERLGVTFSQLTDQRDVVYARSMDDLLAPTRGTVVARVRVDSGSATLTVKVRRDADLDRDEYEVNVDDSEVAEEILRALGLRRLVEVRKRRRKGRANAEDATVLVDEVEGLGTFVELELLGVDPAAGSRTTERFIESIMTELPGARRIYHAYDRLLAERGADP